MERVDPGTSDKEEMVQDFFTMLLVCKYDFRKARAVEQKLDEFGVGRYTEGKNKVHDGWDRSSIIRGIGDQLVPGGGEAAT